MNSSISVILPVLNEAANVEAAIASLPLPVEVIVVDGGSSDGTIERARLLGAMVIHSARGRARQMNAGARLATGDLLVFLHADTRLPSNTLDVLATFWDSGFAWGRFDIRLSGAHPLLRVVEFMMNLRSRVTGICTGDQALFIRRATFEEEEGFSDIPLMEDIEFSRRLKKKSRPWCPKAWVLSSSRRWEERGVLRTILLMWFFRLAYFFHVSPETLAKRYQR